MDIVTAIVIVVVVAVAVVELNYDNFGGSNNGCNSVDCMGTTCRSSP